MARGAARPERRELRWNLELLRWTRPPAGYAYRGAADFVLREGRWFEPAPLPPEIAPGGPRICFGNAIIVAVLYGLSYIEGYALEPWARSPVHHAWNVGAGNRVVDTTWPKPGLAYLGVEFSVERADDATWNGDATVLDDYGRGWPLLREPWPGEDFDREWPPSERLDALRGFRDGDRGGARAWLLANR